jgi:hypothetical protein
MIKNRVIVETPFKDLKWANAIHLVPSTLTLRQSEISGGYEKDKSVGSKETFQNGRNTNAEGSYSKERLIDIVRFEKYLQPHSRSSLSNHI